MEVLLPAEVASLSQYIAPAGGGTRLDVLHQFPARAPWAPFVARYRDAWPRALARLAAHLEREDAR